MKKYITSCFVVLLVMTASSVSAAQPTQMSAEAKTALIKELTIKLNELIVALNALLAGQDARIKSEVSNSRVNAELYYTINESKGFSGACVDIKNRINKSLAASNATEILKTLQMSCFDSKENYALSIKTSKGYSCADSTGTMKSTLGPVVGVTCPVN